MLLSLSLKLVIHKNILFTICKEHSNHSSPSLIIFILQTCESSLLNLSQIGTTAPSVSIVPVYKEVGVTVTF